MIFRGASLPPVHGCDNIQDCINLITLWDKEKLMSNVSVPWYYNQMTAKERSYVDFIGNINSDIGSSIENNAKMINSAIVDAQVATSKAIYNNSREIQSTLMAGFSGVSSHLQSGFSNVSRELGVMSSSMNMGFALLNSAVEKSSREICNKLDDIYDTLNNPLYTGFSELYNRALKNYNNGFYEDVLEDLQEAIKKNKTDPRPHFLMGQTYLRGKNDDFNVIDLDKSIEALETAMRYIKPAARSNPEVRLMAAEICFCLGLAYHAKANDALHGNNEPEYRKLLREAETAYRTSWEFSNNMRESMYNLSRCKALFNETDEAIHYLLTVILQDHGYCIKTFLESDFDNKLKDELFTRLKRDLYPKVKPVYDSIQSIKADFKAPYSDELKGLMDMHFGDSFTQDTAPFDMLKASIYFPKIQSLLKDEKRDFEAKQGQEEKDRVERLKLAEQERQEREKNEKRWAEDKRKEDQKKQWIKEGRCEACGGKIRRFIDKDPYGNNDWVYRIRHRKCKSCGKIAIYAYKGDKEDRKLRVIFTLSELLIAALGSLILFAWFGEPGVMLMLIPFGVLFLIVFRNFGFIKFIRILAFLAQLGFTALLIAEAINSPLDIIVTVIGSVLITFACIMAYKQSLFG